VFVPDKVLQPSVMFVEKARSYPIKAGQNILAYFKNL